MAEPAKYEGPERRKDVEMRRRVIAARISARLIREDEQREEEEREEKEKEKRKVEPAKKKEPETWWL